MCRHYYVTWENQLPHGCRGMKFKSKMIPSAVVMNNSGQVCLLFERKKVAKKTTIADFKERKS
jgi:hypothetical protein